MPLRRNDKQGRKKAMDIRLKLLSGLLAGALISVGTPAMAQTVTVMTAGDQNMVDYVNEFVAP
jgi:hypothetical protein